MANDEYRPQQQADRAKGLEARHTARHERAIRRQVAEEIAVALETLADDTKAAVAAKEFRRVSDAEGAGAVVGIRLSVLVAREIGSKEGGA